MLLTQTQKEVLNELVNIAFGRAAASLSAMVHQRMQLEAPQVMMLSLNELSDALKSLYQADVACVHQVFGGRFNGNALLLMSHADASALLSLLVDEPPIYHTLTPSDREALMEIGNILLNAFIGSFGNLLRERISFMVPVLHVDTVEGMIRSLEIDKTRLHYALFVTTRFVLTKGKATGHLAMIMGVESLEALFSSMEEAGFVID